MNMFRIFSLLVAIFFIAGCTHQKDNTVVIHSMPSDSIFTEISIFKETSNQDVVVFKGGETAHFSVDSVETRHFFSCANNNHFHTQIFITPGDSVSFKTVFKEKGYNPSCENSYEVIFEGENAAHYNYASVKEKTLEEAPVYFSNPDVDLWEFKQKLRAYRDKEKEFLNSYKKENPVSEDFINWASAEIQNRYVIGVQQAAYVACAVPAGYLDSLDIIQNPVSMAASYALQNKYTYNLSDTDMERVYQEIVNEVTPTFRSAISSRFIAYFAEFGDRAYKESFTKVLEEIEKTSMDSTLLATVQEYKPFYLLSGKKLSGSVLDRSFLRSFQGGQKITLRQLLDKHKDTIIYLDFWASWCGPCRYVNSQSEENKAYLTERGISVVYISMDEDEKAWLQAAEDDQITRNQYLLLEIADSPLNQELKIRAGGIPRFVLFNKKHEIEILSAPRPVDCSFDELKGMIERIHPGFLTQMPVHTDNKISYKEEFIPQKEVKKATKTDMPAANLPKEKKGILINGVYWASSNVGAPGTFAGNPEDFGSFYKWNNKTALAVKNPTVRWEGREYYGETWETKNDPSPEGWRVPTLDEVKSLYDQNKVSSEWTAVNNIKGRKFTDKTSGNAIFLPAAGYRRAGSYGALYNHGSTGHYWSSTFRNRMFSYILHFDGEEASWNDWDGFIGDGFSIRPVAE